MYRSRRASDSTLVGRDGQSTFNQGFAWGRLGWVVWGGFILGLSVLSVLAPHRCIAHVYRAASLNWWSGVDLYSEGIHGFLYLPTSAVLYSPFAFLPPLVGSMAWRWLSVMLLTLAMVRLVRLLLPRGSARSVLAVMLLAVIPAAAVNIVRAQSEIIMFALMALASVDLARSRWDRAAVFLTLAVAFKPLALVLALLWLALVPEMRWRLVAGLLIMLMLPFLHPDPAYVLTQYTAAAGKLLVAAAPGQGRWNELNSLLVRIGAAPLPEQLTKIRFLGGILALGLATIARERQSQRQAAISILTIAVCYLLLFNPRTEEGSYLNLAIVAALYAGIAWHAGNRRRLAAGLILLCFGLGTHCYGDWIYRPTDLWLKPLLGVIFLFGFGLFTMAAETPASSRPVVFVWSVWRARYPAKAAAAGDK